MIWNLGLVTVGLWVMGRATAAFKLAVLGPVAWMVAIGAGLYLAYTPFNAQLFDRLMAATAAPGDANFCSMSPMRAAMPAASLCSLSRSFVHVSLRWTSFLGDVAYAASAIGLVAVAVGLVRLLRLPAEPTSLAAVAAI